MTIFNVSITHSKWFYLRICSTEIFYLFLFTLLMPGGWFRQIIFSLPKFYVPGKIFHCLMNDLKLCWLTSSINVCFLYHFPYMWMGIFYKSLHSLSSCAKFLEWMICNFATKVNGLFVFSKWAPLLRKKKLLVPPWHEYEYSKLIMDWIVYLVSKPYPQLGMCTDGTSVLV